jgi:hypothetical protein
VRRRQADGLLPADLDPAILRLLGFALVSYLLLLPQITRMATAMSPSDPEFVAAWESLLRRIGDLLEQDARRSGERPRRDARSAARYTRALRHALRAADSRFSG